jgi:hypothetical protein
MRCAADPSMEWNNASATMTASYQIGARSERPEIAADQVEGMHFA